MHSRSADCRFAELWGLGIQDPLFNDFLSFEFFGGSFGPSRLSLLCIVGKLARGGSVAVAVGFSNR